MEPRFSKLLTPHKIPHLVLEPSYKKGEFDSHTVDCPFPFHHNGRYYMIYIGWDGIGYRTGLAHSDDLIHWTKDGLILDRGPKGSVTEFNAALSNILRDNELFGPGTPRKVLINGRERFLGTYHAYPAAGLESGAAVIGLCTSDDLFHWEVGEPVLRAEDGTDWERGGLYKSWIMEHDGVYYLFYNAKNQAERGWIEQTGFATSRDLRTWERYVGNPVVPIGAADAFDSRFASDPCVFHYGDQWVMFYYGAAADNHARDGFAVSDDLVHWTKGDRVLIDVGPPGSIDSRYAHKPGVIAKDGVLYHFYCAVSPAGSEPLGEISYSEKRGIGVAHG